MRGNEEQAQNEATFTADLLAALTRESIPATPTSIPLQSDFLRKLNAKCFDLTPWLKMCVSLHMKLLSATTARHFKDINPSLAWYTQACNDIMDQFNGQVGRNRAVKLGAISGVNWGPLLELERLFGEFLEWKAQTAGIDRPEYYLAPTTHSNLRQSILAFTAMCRHYIGIYPDVTIPQWRVNDDVIEHHFRNIRGSAGDNTTPTIKECCTATRHASIIRLVGDTAGNSGGAPIAADDNDESFGSYVPPLQVRGSGMSTRELLFAHNYLAK